MSDSGGPAIDFNELIDVATNFATFGLVGYDAKKGSLKQGLITHSVDETIGEVTGRNMARQEANRAEYRLNLQEQQNARDLKDKQLQDYRTDLARSRGAQAAQKTTDAARGGTFDPSSGPLNLGADAQDFLGL